MHSNAKTVKEYLASLPPERRKDMELMRTLIKKNLPKGFQEIMDGMIVYSVPLKTYPAGYLNNPQYPLPCIGLASQKNNMALYLMTVYADPKLDAWFRKTYKATGKKLDMGKSCIRFKSVDKLALDVIAEVLTKVSVEDYVASYELGNLKMQRSIKKKKK